MPRSRDSDKPLRQHSPRVPLHLKTTACSESNLRHSVERSPKLDDHRRSPRSPLPEKKRAARIAELETKLTKTQEELKKLKEQLADSEAAKKCAEQELEETKKKLVNVSGDEHAEEEKTPEVVPTDETDVFEVVTSALSEAESYKNDEEVEEAKAMIEEDVTPKEENSEISELSAKLVEMDETITSLAAESEALKKQVEESKLKEEEMSAKLLKTEAELKGAKEGAEKLGVELEMVKEAKAGIEAEMKRMRVQTEQWRKAAEAAAAVLTTADESGARVSERCGSMEKSLGGFYGSPAGGDMVEEDGKRKSSGGGMRMFWKKGGGKY